MSLRFNPQQPGQTPFGSSATGPRQPGQRDPAVRTRLALVLALFVATIGIGAAFFIVSQSYPEPRERGPYVPEGVPVRPAEEQLLGMWRYEAFAPDVEKEMVGVVFITKTELGELLYSGYEDSESARQPAGDWRRNPPNKFRSNWTQVASDGSLRVVVDLGLPSEGRSGREAYCQFTREDRIRLEGKCAFLQPTVDAKQRPLPPTYRVNLVLQEAGYPEPKREDR